MRETQRAALLPVGFFARPASVVAEALIGAVVWSSIDGGLTAGRVVETEAYLGHEDPASHAFGHRRHAQNEALYGLPATWYVYRSYGMHWCANLVCQSSEQGSAVLLRALEPIAGLETMRVRRRGVVDRELCSGPGKLCQALGMTRGIDGVPMRRSAVQVRRGMPAGTMQIVAGPRVGITRAAEWPLRFMESGSRWVSRGPVRL